MDQARSVRLAYGRGYLELQLQVIVQMVIQRKAKVLVHSRLPDDQILSAKLKPCHDIPRAVTEWLDRAGDKARSRFCRKGR